MGFVVLEETRINLAHVVTYGPGQNGGLIVVLSNGPQLYFETLTPQRLDEMVFGVALKV